MTCIPVFFYYVLFIKICLTFPWEFYYRYLECKGFRIDHLNILPYFLINISCAPVVFKELLGVIYYTHYWKNVYFCSFLFQLSVHYEYGTVANKIN